VVAKPLWDSVRLEQVAAEITVGFVGPMAHEYVDSGVPFLRSQNVLAHRIDMEDVRYIGSEFHTKLKKSRLTPGDVVIVRTGKPGTAAVIPPWLQEANCADLVIVRPSEALNPHFLAYFINAVAHHHVYAHIVGAVQQHFNVGSAKSMLLPLPPRPVQDAMVEHLRTFDEKMEVSRQVSASLEALLRSLFKSWLVDFEVSIAAQEGRPVPIAPALDPYLRQPLVDTSLGLAPPGWKVVQLGDLLESLESGARPKGGVAAIRDGVPSLGAEHILKLGEFDFATVKFVPRDFFSTLKRGVVRPWDIALYKDGAHIGRKTMWACGFPFAECAVNEHVFLLRARPDVGQPYLFFWLDLPDVTADIVAMNSNSAQPGLNQTALKRLAVLKPPSEVTAIFNRIAQPLLVRIFENARESMLLRELRDSIAPGVLSGELTVRDVERVAEAVA
jgi:type I restriction enzyme S subunit